jgi:L-asparaginase
VTTRPRPTVPATAPATVPVTVLATGGTVACITGADGTRTPTRTVSDLLQDAALPATAVRDARDVLHLDSSTMTLDNLDSLLAEIAAAATQGPVVLTHGTDSMEETAMAVDRLIGGPVVLTGAQRPADDAAPDGPGNLRDALTAAGEVTAPVIAMGGARVPAYGARKVHTVADRAFDNPLPDAAPAPLTTTPPPLAGLRVDIVAAYQGGDATLVDAAVDAGAAGIVVAAFGSGNVGVLSPGVERALDRGIPVVICTRVPGGPVDLVYGGPGGGARLARRGVRSGGLLSPAQARMELLCELAVTRRDCPAGPRG